MERTLRWSPAPKRDDHSPIAQRAALARLLTLASWVPFGPNKGRMGRLKAVAPGLPTRQSEASPVASACLPAARSWHNFSCSWCKQEVDTACLPPGCAPSGRPIESTLVSWVPLGPNKGRMGRLCAFGPGLPTRLSGPVASAWLPGRAPSGGPIEPIAPHLLIDSRPGSTDDSTYIATLSGVTQCEGSSSFRWSWGRQLPCLSATIQVPKLNGVQVTDGKQGPTHKWNRCVKRSFMPACNRAIRTSAALVPVYLSFYSDTRGVCSCRSSLPCPDADRTPAAATCPILGWDGPHWAPAPRMLRDVVWVLTLRPSGSQLVRARKLCSGDALRPDFSWVPNHTVPSVCPPRATCSSQDYRVLNVVPQCALLGPLAVHRTTGCCAWSSVCPPGATAVLRTALCAEKHHDECKMP